MKKDISRQEYRLFMEAWSALAMARLVLLLRPFKKIVPFFKKDIHQQSPGNTEDLIPMIQLAIMRAAKRSPWRTRCFEQAIAAKMMLNRRGMKSEVLFGLKKNDDGSMAAHAWVKSGDTIVTGWQKVNEYTVVANF